jgi:hypothetical protein
VVREDYVGPLLAEMDPDPEGPVKASHRHPDGGRLTSAHYTACFSGVPDETVRRIAHARNRVPATLRGLLLAVLAEPEDPGALGALRDWIEELQIPKPGSVSIGGLITIPTNRKMSFRWWNTRGHGFPRALAYHLPRGGQYDRSRDDPDRPLFSFDDLTSLTADDILQLPHIGPHRLKQLRAWLAECGLYLRGETPSLFQEAAP